MDFLPPSLLRQPPTKTDPLALAIAQGKSVVGWATVPTSTAYRCEPTTVMSAAAPRTGAAGPSIGAGPDGPPFHAGGQHDHQACQAAESESVQLRAARAVLSDLIAVSKHANLECRMGQIEETLSARNGDANGQRLSLQSWTSHSITCRRSSVGIPQRSASGPLRRPSFPSTPATLSPRTPLKFSLTVGLGDCLTLRPANPLATTHIAARALGTLANRGRG